MVHSAVNVLVWTPFFYPDIGGIESMLANLLPHLRGRDIGLAVVASHGPSNQPDEADFAGIPVYRFRFREAVSDGQPRKVFGLLSQITRLKQALRPSVVHVHFSDPSVFFHLQTRQSYSAPTIVTLHQDYQFFGIEPGTKSVLTKTLAAASWITGVSHRTLDQAAPFLEGVDTPTSVIYNGVRQVNGQYRADIDFERPTILCIGRMVEQKGFDDAIRVFVEISARFPDTTLAFAGDGPLENQLRRQVMEAGIERRTRFLGRVEPTDIPAVISDATLVLAPSRVEAFPMVPLEAGLMGRPVVCTNVGGVSEAVVDGQTGIVVEPEDHDSLVDAVSSLLSSPDLCRQMGTSARERVLSNFTIEAAADAYAKLYHDVINQWSE